MNIIKSWILFTLIFLIDAPELFSQADVINYKQNQALINELKNLVTKEVEVNQFSGSVLIAKNGNPLINISKGKSVFMEDKTINESTRFSIASITKLFTVIRILQLIESKELTLSSSLSSILPHLKINKAQEITIHHLMLHLSGLPNEPDEIYLEPLSPAELVIKVVQSQPSNKLGKFNYNNVDYMLLGLIIEEITQNSWHDEILNYIINPLNMNETGFLKYDEYPSEFAYPYSYMKSGEVNVDPLFYIENFYAAGCMYSSPKDLLKLDQALYSERLIKRKSYDLLSKSYPEYNYAGYGVWNYNYPFLNSQPRIMERRGGILGSNSVLVRMPDSKHTIIILSNNNRFNPDSFGDENNLREAIIRKLVD